MSHPISIPERVDAGVQKGSRGEVVSSQLPIGSRRDLDPIDIAVARNSASLKHRSIVIPGKVCLDGKFIPTTQLLLGDLLQTNTCCQLVIS